MNKRGRRRITGFRAKIEPAATKIAWHGMLNSNSQAILKFTVPGFPDIYQGTELLDFNLVDPDNRRTVDFAVRKKILEEVQTLSSRPRQDGRIKMSSPGCSTFVISRRRFSRPEATTHSMPTEASRSLRRFFPGVGLQYDVGDCPALHNSSRNRGVSI
jgi:hypothetical protein